MKKLVDSENFKNSVKEVFKNIEKLEAPKSISFPQDDPQNHFLDLAKSIYALECGRRKYIRKLEAFLLSRSFTREINNNKKALADRQNYQTNNKKERKILDKLASRENKISINKLIVITVNNALLREYPRKFNLPFLHYNLEKGFNIEKHESKLVRFIKKHHIKKISFYENRNPVWLYIKILEKKIFLFSMPLENFPYNDGAINDFITLYPMKELKESYELEKRHTSSSFEHITICSINRAIKKKSEQLAADFFIEYEKHFQMTQEINYLYKSNTLENIDINRSIELCSEFIKGFEDFSKVTLATFEP